MINDNCLAGYKCPKCNSQGPFVMDTKCRMNWDDDGTDAGGDYAQNMEIIEDGHSYCVECGHSGKTSEFNVEKNYVARGGNHCPYCGSDIISGGNVEQDAHLAWADVQCDDCGAEWQDLYTLTGLGNYPDHDFVTETNEGSK